MFNKLNNGVKYLKDDAVDIINALKQRVASNMEPFVYDLKAYADEREKNKEDIYNLEGLNKPNYYPPIPDDYKNYTPISLEQLQQPIKNYTPISLEQLQQPIKKYEPTTSYSNRIRETYSIPKLDNAKYYNMSWADEANNESPYTKTNQDIVDKFNKLRAKVDPTGNKTDREIVKLAHDQKLISDVEAMNLTKETSWYKRLGRTFDKYGGVLKSLPYTAAATAIGAAGGGLGGALLMGALGAKTTQDRESIDDIMRRENVNQKQQQEQQYIYNMAKLGHDYTMARNKDIIDAKRRKEDMDFKINNQNAIRKMNNNRINSMIENDSSIKEYAKKQIQINDFLNLLDINKPLTTYGALKSYEHIFDKSMITPSELRIIEERLGDDIMSRINSYFNKIFKNNAITPEIRNELTVIGRMLEENNNRNMKARMEHLGDLYQKIDLYEE